MPSISQLHIERQFAQIGIKTTNAQVRISTQRPQMRIVSDGRPEMRVDRQPARFKVNWQKVRDESGLMGPVQSTIDRARQGAQQALEYTGESVREGDFLGDLTQPGNRVARLARNKSLKTAETDINLGSMPQSLPEIEWDPGYVRISWSNADLQVEWDADYMPTFSVEPHSVEIFLRNRPYIKISVIEDVAVKQMGRHVDENI